MKNLTLLFLINDRGILLAMKKRGLGVGRWNGVGGKVEPDETVEQAMLRECYEEIKVKPINYKKVSDIKFNEFHEGKPKSFIVSVFSCSEWGGEPTETEEMSPKWFNFDEIPYDDMWPDDRYWLEYVLQNKNFTAEFTLDENDEIISHIISEVT
jgi:8-oxo-dGTP diphosphatase/2-hydroxy-dATP diphosphatase